MLGKVLHCQLKLAPKVLLVSFYQKLIIERPLEVACVPQGQIPI